MSLGTQPARPAWSGVADSAFALGPAASSTGCARRLASSASAWPRFRAIRLSRMAGQQVKWQRDNRRLPAARVARRPCSRAGTPSSNTSRKPLAYCRATRSRSAARAMIVRRVLRRDFGNILLRHLAESAGAGQADRIVSKRCASTSRLSSSAPEPCPRTKLPSVGTAARGASSSRMPRFVLVVDDPAGGLDAFQDGLADAASGKPIPGPGPSRPRSSRKSR